MWFHPHGSKDMKKAAGRIEFRLERLRLDMSPNKKKNVMRKLKRKFVPAMDNTAMVCFNLIVCSPFLFYFILKSNLFI